MTILIVARPFVSIVYLTQMPLYEYRCNKCHKRITLLVRENSSDLACPVCGGQELSRLFSTFSIKHTYLDNYESILDDSQLVKGLERDDPRALAEWNRRMSRGAEDDNVGPEYQEMLEKMDRGEVPTTPVGQEATPEPSTQGA